MGLGYVSNFLEFLVNVIFGILIFLVLLRFILQIVRANFHSPLTGALVRVTNPMLVPLRRIIPGLGGIDFASIVLLLLLQTAHVLLIGLLPGRSIVAPPGLFLLVLGLLIDHVVWLYFFTVLIQVLIGWINPMAIHHPVGHLLMQVNEPWLRPLRRKFKPINEFDISPLIFIVILMAVHFMIATPLIDVGQHSAP